jgi:hypothetical protein
LRFVGILLFFAGSAILVRAVRGADAEPRPRDVAWALAAPAAVLMAITGLVLLFVPGFL